MLDFEEELKKFVYSNNLADVTDLIDEMLKEIKDRR